MIDKVRKILGLSSRKTGNKLILSVEKIEARVALLETGLLEEYSVERKSSRNIVGSVYKGKVKNIEMGLKVMFVDIGFEKNAFLHFWDAIPAALDSGIEEIDRRTNKRPRKRITVKDIPSIYLVGSDVIVQVTKGPIGTKGSRVTTNLSFAGRYLVLMPFSDRSGISRKIENPKERDRLRKILRELDIPEGVGVIIRTVGEGQRTRYFVRDLRFLLDQWAKVEQVIRDRPAPCRIFEEPDLVERTVRDFLTEEIDEVICDDRESINRMNEMVGQISRRARNRIHFYDGATPIYENCPYCGGHGVVKTSMTTSVELHRTLNTVMRKYQDSIHEIRVILNPDVLKRLKEEDEELLVELERRYAGRLMFRGDPTFHHEKFTITDANTGAELKA